MSKTRADLIKSITKLDLAEVLKCLNDGVDFNECDSKSVSPLSIASDACKFSDEEHQALFEIVELLILRGAEINKKSYDGCTPLHYAVNSNFRSAINILIENKADVNIQTNYKETPLEIAVNDGHTDVVKLLLTNKADPTLIKPRESTSTRGCLFVPGNKVIRQLLEEAKRTQPVSSLNKM